MSTSISVPAGLEPHYSVQEIARALNVSANSVRRLFDEEPGVVRISNPRILRRKRSKYVTLRIPLSVYDRVRTRLSSGCKVEPGHRGI